MLVQIALAGEGPSTSRLSTGKFLTELKIYVTMLCLDVIFQGIAGCKCGATIRACGGMFRLDMGLQCWKCWEANICRTDCAVVRSPRMYGITMVPQIAFDIKACAARCSVMVLVMAHKWFFLALMNDCNVLLKCVMFSKLLPTSSIGAGELLPLHMQVLMSLQSRRCNETFAAALPLTDIVSSLRVC